MVRRTCLALVAVALALAGIEGACALGEYLAYGARWTGGGPAGLYVRQANGRPRLRPRARLDGWLYEVHINSMGFRGPELADPRPPDALRVWCAGGSTTFDVFARDDAAAWPARLERRLAEALPERAVEVVNAGVPARC